jgi:L-lactate dehydrogenase complex protein LldF
MGNGRQDFKTDAAHALADTALQKALQNVKRGFVDKRKAARAKLPEFDTLREDARAIKDHTLSHLDLYLETYERKVTESGGSVHYAPTAADARAIILKLCQEAGAKLVTKGKSMVSEEIGLNAHLQAAKIEVVETDLGEYIVQLRGERPSHIIAPVIHLNKETIEADFRRAHHRLPRERRLDQAQYLVAEARKVLREKFLAADVGITGANLLIAETGSSVIVTNEGNGDLTSTLPRMHIVIASIEKIVPTLEDAMIILRLLARSATGQEITTWCFSTMDGARCSATSSPTCSAASAAAPASIIARSMAPSAGTLTGRSIRARWARC